MRLFFESAKPLFQDLASTLIFLVVFLLTSKLQLAVTLGMVLGAAQISWAHVRMKPIGALQLLSFFTVMISGAATLITRDPRFVMIKPSLFYLVAGIVMSKPGWMIRYLPPAAKQSVPDIANLFGFIWAGLMFTSAILNVYVALNFGIRAWSAFIPAFAILSKAGLFLICFATMRMIGGRRRAQMLPTPP